MVDGTTITGVGPAAGALFGAWVLAIALSLAAPFWATMAFYDRLIIATAPAPSPEIVLVGVDQPSFAEFSEAWPWSRGRHATLVRALHHAGARVIVFDILFADPSPDRQSDAALAEAMAAHGAVVLAAARDVVSSGQYDIASEIRPTAQFTAAAAQIGIVELPIDPDGVLRRMSVAEGSLPAIVARLAVGRAPASGRVSPAAHDLIRYRRIAGGRPYASFYQAVDADEALPPAFFEDRIVVIGFETGAGDGQSSDRFETPFTRIGGGTAPGYRVLAEAIEDELAALETGRGGVSGLGAPAAAALAAAALGALWPVARRWRPGRALGLGAVSALGAIAISFGVLAVGDAWIPPAPALTAVAAALIGLGARAWIDERLLRREIRRAFARYVPDEVIQAMGRGGYAPAQVGDVRDVTFVFTDLASFTPFTENTPPDQLLATLRAYFDEMTAIIFEHRGTLERFTGDGLVALFNAPLDQPDHADRALACAAALAAAGRRLSDQWRAAGVALGHTRIGVNTGAVIVGNFGSSERFHYTAMGTPINVAARLEAAAKTLGVDVCVGAATAAAATSHRIPGAVLREVGPLRLSGLDAPLAVFALLPTDIAAPSEDYEAALALRETDPTAAIAAFEALAVATPLDPVATLHLERLRAGDGPTIDARKEASRRSPPRSTTG